MKWLVAVLLLANIGLALWVYGREPSLPAAPHPLHAKLLRRVSPGKRPLTQAPAPIPIPAAPAPVPDAGAKHPAKAGRPGKPLHAPQAGLPPKPLQRRPRPQVLPPAVSAGAKTACWQLGPVLGRARAVRLLRRLHVPGRVVSRLGPPAYRVFLPVGAPWPSAAVLVRAGVRGAYVAHGPTGAEVLSLGVFLKHAAALAEARHLQSRHLAVLIAPFGAPTHYYDRVRLTRVSAALWRKLGPIGHTVCAQAR